MVARTRLVGKVLLGVVLLVESVQLFILLSLLLLDLID